MQSVGAAAAHRHPATARVSLQDLAEPSIDCHPSGSLMNSIHVEAYMETVIDILQTRDTKDSILATLKKVGLISGGALLGTVAMGPIGMIVGGGLAGGAASEMGGPDEDMADMILYLRALELKDKAALVHQLEDLVEDTETEKLVTFCKTKSGRDRFVTLVCDFLLDNTPMFAHGVHPRSRFPVPLVKPAHYEQLLDFGEND